MKILTAVVLSVLAVNALAADYDYVDPGDYYYINGWGDNQSVMVVRKMGYNQLKVRDLNTGETEIVNASKLLTKSELGSEEFVNGVTGTAIGIGILYCWANPGEC
ncbi:hypothetical protein PN36_14460 [Candidatus Thiomargarita nelsonii]|uniref:Secreted protein n=1 Tax=Candidatus Thiomargarita nelsonii TaxID=1003181 RepID=A0A0A6PNB7_9GAMM|nr:hypothetical protein PN36_14460 [Candidatus Thiomargarita nelsonii]